VRTLRFTRRSFAGASAGLAIFAFAAPRAIAQEATPGGEWVFTDDKGVTVTADAMPQRIVADVNAAAPLWDFGIRPVAVFGWNATEDGDFGPAGGNVDPSAVEIVGNVSEPIQPEAVAAVQADLLVTLTWTPDDPTEYWSIDAAILPQVEPIAPLVAISATGMADANTERFAELAAALGANLGSPEIVEAKVAFDAALAGFPAVAAEKADLTALFVFVGGDEKIYVANAPDWADLNLYASLGLNIVKPDAEADSFWEELSMEEALKYPADVIFNSTRPGTLTIDELKAHPVFGQHPAAQAGQMGPWNQDFIMSYQGMTIALDTTIAPVRDARKVTE
jgi:iron complex transport system substrate-binding protein